MAGYEPVERISADHDTATFDCGSQSQSEWLRKYALQADRAGTSRVYVTCETGGRRVAAYYALAAGSVEPADAPRRVSSGAGLYPIPIILLTRLGVDVRDQRGGLGRRLVRDALQRVATSAGQVGVRALLIEAESPEARRFYEHLAEFEPSPTDDLRLFLLMKDLVKALTDPV